MSEMSDYNLFYSGKSGTGFSLFLGLGKLGIQEGK